MIRHSILVAASIFTLRIDTYFFFQLLIFPSIFDMIFPVSVHRVCVLIFTYYAQPIIQTVASYILFSVVIGISTLIV